MNQSSTARAELCAQSLQRAQSCRSLSNMAHVIAACHAAGMTDAEPGVNVLTYNAWQALGRQVRKGEKAIAKVPVIFTRTGEDKDGQSTARKVMTGAAVFHISQTDARVTS